MAVVASKGSAEVENASIMRLSLCNNIKDFSAGHVKHLQLETATLSNALSCT